MLQEPIKPSCIDLCLTNAPKKFQSSCVVETGLSDFHKMTVVINKSTFEKIAHKVVHYRDYRNYSKLNFTSDLIDKLEQEKFGDENLIKYVNLFREVLNKHAPKKQKSLRGNHSPL